MCGFMLMAGRGFKAKCETKDKTRAFGCVCAGVRGPVILQLLCFAGI